MLLVKNWMTSRGKAKKQFGSVDLDPCVWFCVIVLVLLCSFGGLSGSRVIVLSQELQYVCKAVCCVLYVRCQGSVTNLSQQGQGREEGISPWF